VSGASETKRGCTASVNGLPSWGRGLRGCIVAAIGGLYDFAAVAAFVIRTLVNALALIVAVELVPKIKAPNEIWQLLVVAAIFGLINAYLRPIFKLLSLPLNLLTFGLVGFVINTGLLLLLAFVSNQLKLGFSIAGWPQGAFSIEVIVYAFIASLVISVVSALVAFVRMVVPRI
jgi:putative membrane protein